MNCTKFVAPKKPTSLAVQAALVDFAGNVRKFTKRLRLQTVRRGQAARKLVISTNWLHMVGLEPGSRVVERVIGPLMGLEVVPAPVEAKASKLVYERSYKNRKTQSEAMLDIRGQRVLSEALGTAEEVHIQFTRGRVLIRPVFEHAQTTDGVGACFALPDGEGAYGAVAQAVSVIEKMAFARLSVGVSEDFFDSTVFVLFQLQLKRLGYEIRAEGNTLSAWLPGHESAPVRLVDIQSLDIKPSIFKRETLSRLGGLESYEVFSLCSSGVDTQSLMQEGFVPRALLEYRPPEARDYRVVKVNGQSRRTGELERDWEEFGAACAAINTPTLRAVFNEDIYRFDPSLVSNDISGLSHLVGSIQCDHFSRLMDKDDRQAAIDNLSTSCDMFFPLLRIVESGLLTLTIENVESFVHSEEYAILKARLEYLGYRVYSAVLKGQDYNSYTLRPRAFVFATLLDSGFEFPSAEPHMVNFWTDVVEPTLPDILDRPCSENSVSSALRKGRMNAVSEGAKICRTLTKSQAKLVDDAVRIKVGEQYYWPALSTMKGAMSIPQAFNVEPFPSEFKTEVIGQSVCLAVHGALMRKIREHISSFFSRYLPATSEGLGSCQLELLF